LFKGIKSKAFQGVQRSATGEGCRPGYSVSVWWFQYIQMDCSY